MKGPCCAKHYSKCLFFYNMWLDIRTSESRTTHAACEFFSAAAKCPSVDTSTNSHFNTHLTGTAKEFKIKIIIINEISQIPLQIKQLIHPCITLCKHK